MTRSIHRLTRHVSALAMLALALGSVGCSSARQTSLLVEPQPAVSLNAVATADDTFVAQSYSLVAADSIGLATFGQQIVLDDQRAREDRFADAR